MIRTVIIDDEQHCIDSLAFDLQKNCKEIEILETCTNPKEGLLAIKKHKPDLVFLDVQMPVDVNDLKEAVKKATEKIQHNSGVENIANLLQNIRQPEGNQRIAFPGRDGYEFVEAGKVIYAQAEGSYTHVFLNDKRKLVISKTLSDIEEMLPPDLFHRIHHSTLVNLSHVTHLYKSDGGYIVLENGEKLAVSKSKKDSLMERLGLKKE